MVTNLENCFGIGKLEHDFNFLNTDVITIYARNGLMKTSFSKTFKKIQDKKENEIRDEIFEIQGNVDIKIDGEKIQPTDIFVIKSFESYYECNNISSLLVDDNIKNKINNVLNLKNKFLKKLEKKSGMKISKTLNGKKVPELEKALVSDFGFEEKSFLLNIKTISEMKQEIFFTNVLYKEIFDSVTLKKIKSKNFQNKIEDFCDASHLIYDSYGFLKKGSFTLPKLKKIAASLDSDKFFSTNNGLLLNGEEIKNYDKLDTIIKEIDDKIKDVPEFKEIEKLLSDSKGIQLKDIIENNPEIIPYLKITKLDDLKIQLWLSYMKILENEFASLLKEYINLESEILNIEIDSTLWKEALALFKERFTVPYEMEIENIKSSVIGESIPRVEFKFYKKDSTVKLGRNDLENKDILSQGEKRALYLLNIIFDIENLKKTDKEILFIVDDIADSFDYKNKYAIVEYLYELAKNPNFKLIILSHNFDFYRTVSSRLSVERECRLRAEKKNNSIYFEKETYQKQPFLHWKKNLNNTEYIIALIPFVRNLIDFGVDRNVASISGVKNDFDLLTNLLHDKDKTYDITFNVLKKIYKEYLSKDNLNSKIDLNTKVVDEIFNIAENLNENNALLEHKIILSIAIRHKAEKYMKNVIKNSNNQIKWIESKSEKSGDSNAFLNYLQKGKNQTRELLEAYKQISTQNLMCLEEVNIMTPENIHLNSFMYESILDMDIYELLNLYRNVEKLC